MGHDLWTEALEAATRDPLGVGSIPCPDCGARSLRIAFVVDRPEDTSAVVAFWCDSCLYGMVPQRVRLPEDVVPVGRADGSGIPYYSLVSPT
ncbi:MAG: hypothetical protein FWF90_01270 [Promicromonosporaceae bacterium]|nr:hypothetical protein [Promicromonosporaceae bacterium]